ncbi:MAG: NADH-quinone oxidoreductase subunit NuoH [Planctomycetes bacterium]|nr:NADH-quinone oxidoreductase subunit NuoH [Planctomycetota bacterium]
MHEFHFWPTLITIVVIFCALQATAGFLVYVERKICAYMQNRIGPNRVGPYGLLQVLADGLKFILKEEFVPKTADKGIFLLAPCIAITTAMLSFAVVPFGATDNDAQAYQFVIAPGLDIGILFIFAISSLAVYAIILGGWASNNKYSMLGGLRSSAQIISYEIPLGLSILGVVLLTGSLNLEDITWRQTSAGWNIFFQPLAFLLFMTSAFAECNRLPFDLPESEQELVGGYHTEYNAFKLAMFLLGEYVHMITTSFLMVILFFGGWHFPFIAGPDAHWIWKLIVIAGKVTFFILLYMLVRWTLPRFRFDQLMGLAWKVLIPLALANVIAVMFVVEFRISPWVLLPVSIGILVGAAAPALRPMNGAEPIRAEQ